MFNNYPIFIGGSMKSGTTLLRKLVANHPNIFGGLETHWFSSEFQDTWEQPESKRQKWLREFFELTLHDYLQIRQASKDAISFFNNFMNYCTNRDNKKRWVEKTPGNISHIPLIRANWPKGKIINSVRDCRDVYASWKKINKKDLSFFIAYFHKINEAIGDILFKETEYYMSVIYEDLVDNPHTVLKRVFDFIGEEYYQNIGNFDGDSDEYEKILRTTGKTSSTAISLSKPINKTSVGQYQTILTKNEISTLEKEFEFYLNQFGYLN